MPCARKKNNDMKLDYNKFSPYKYMEWMVGARHYVMNYELKKGEEYYDEAELAAKNYATFRNKLEPEDSEIFAKNVRYFQMLAATDQYYPFLVNQLKLTGFEKVSDIFSKQKAAVYCTFHIGSYRMTNQFLIANKIPFCLVVDQNFISTQGEAGKQRLEEMQVELTGERFFEVELLNAEHRTTGLEVIRRIKKGISVLFYIDGNTGVNQFSNDPAKMVQVPFFNQTINARKGISYISYKAQVPVVPIYSLRHDWLKTEMIFTDPIYPTPGQAADDYCLDTTKKLFNILESAVTTYPEQWEGWYYVHKFLSQSPAEVQHEVPSLLFNKSLYQILQLGDKIFLYNKENQEANEISTSFKSVLNYLSDHKHKKNSDLVIDDMTIRTEALNELIEKNILICI